MVQTPGAITMLGDARWKGGATHNGMLLKLHENCFTAGYSKITPQSAILPAKFGYGVWYDASLHNNQVFVVRPTGGTTEAVFAGILARSPGIANGYPAANNQVQEFQRGLLVKEGFIEYKKGTVTIEDDQAFADVHVGMNMFISNTTGRPRFEPEFTITGFTLVGFVYMTNPDDLSWTVKVSVGNTMQAAQASAIAAALIALIP